MALGVRRLIRTSNVPKVGVAKLWVYVAGFKVGVAGFMVRWRKLPQYG